MIVPEFRLILWCYNYLTNVWFLLGNRESHCGCASYTIGGQSAPRVPESTGEHVEFRKFRGV
jgi:hypothetical protein